MKRQVDVLTMFVAGKIEECRDRKGITQDQLAEMVGLSRPSLVNMENGRQGISLKRVFQFAEVLEVEPGELLPTRNWYKEFQGKRLRKVVKFVLKDD